MITWIFPFALIAFTRAEYYPHPHGVTIGITPYSHPVLSQYHAQDIYGQYSYGFATPTQTKSETKTADGVTHGGYSYIDSNGHLQTVQYTADPIHGFRVAASNLPVDLPEVAYAKAKHLVDFEGIKAEHAAIGAARQAEAVHYSDPVVVPYNTAPQPVQELPEVLKARAEHYALTQKALAVAYSNPVVVPYSTVQQVPAPVQELPEVVKARNEHFALIEATKQRDALIAQEHAKIAHLNTVNLSPIPSNFVGTTVPVSAPVLVPSPVVGYATKYVQEYAPIAYGPPSEQYHAQDGYGQYTYGYTGPLSTKSETRSADGSIRGGYSYIDGNGIVQSVHYVADAAHGFRVQATNLPVH